MRSSGSTHSVFRVLNAPFSGDPKGSAFEQIVPNPNFSVCHRTRYVQLSVMLLSLCLGPTAVLYAQSGSDAKSPSSADLQPEPPISVAEALDNALRDLRIAEANGPNRKAAFDRVRAALDAVDRQDGTNRRARFYNARLLILAGRRDEALRLVEEWTESPQGRNDWEGHFILGKLYAEGSYYTLAKPVLQKALELNPREPRIHAELSKCESATMNREAAVKHARQAVTLMGDGATPAAHVLLAQSLAANGEWDEAQKQARLAVNLAANDVRAQGPKVSTLQTLDQCLVVALQLKRQKLQAGGGPIDLYLEISELILRRAEVASQLADHQALDAAVQGLQAAGDRPPEPLLLHTIRMFMKLGITDQAASLTRQMLEIYPDNADAKKLRRQLPPSPSTEPQP